MTQTAQVIMIDLGKIPANHFLGMLALLCVTFILVTLIRSDK